MIHFNTVNHIFSVRAITEFFRHARGKEIGSLPSPFNTGVCTVFKEPGRQRSGMLMLVGLLAVPILAYASLGGAKVMALIDQSGVEGGVASFSSLFYDGGEPIRGVTIMTRR